MKNTKHITKVGIASLLGLAVAATGSVAFASSDYINTQVGNYTSIVELTDEDWDDLDEEFFAEDKAEMIQEAQEDYAAIKSELSADVQEQVEAFMAQLLGITDEEALFEIGDKMYLLVEDQLDAYYESVGVHYEDITAGTEGIITDADWDTLSMAQIDAKMIAAGKDTVGDSQDPMYKLTEAQIDALTDTEWDAIDAQYEALYGDEFYDEDWDDLDEEFFAEDKAEMIQEAQEDYAAIKSELSADVQEQVEAFMAQLLGITDEEALFEIGDKMYLLVEDQLDAYYHSIDEEN